MTYTIMYLDDDDTFKKTTREDISERDKNAEILLASTISEAKQLLIKHTDIAFIIVDLWLTKELRAPGEIPRGGYDFVKWVLSEERLSELPILVVTAYGDNMLPKLNEKLNEIILEKGRGMQMQIQKRICTVSWTNDYDDWDKAIHRYIDNARHKYSNS